MTTSTLPATDTQADTIDALRRRALELCAARRHDSALLTLRSAIGLHPHNATLLADLSAILLHAGQPAKAAEAARQALALEPDRDMAAYTLALALETGAEARSLLLDLTEGGRAARFGTSNPQLAEHARQALAEMPIAPAATATFPTRSITTGTAKNEPSRPTQPAGPDVGVPMPDDEALLLYALARVMRVRRVLGVGGQSAHSARNFLAALGSDAGIEVVTVDPEPVPPLAPNHRVLIGDCARIDAAHLGSQPFELVFLDAHVVLPQLALLDRLKATGLLASDAVVALHAAMLHPHETVPHGDAVDGTCARVNPAAERQLVNVLHSRGWNALNLLPPLARGGDRPLVRHGLTLMQRFSPLNT